MTTPVENADVQRAADQDTENRKSRARLGEQLLRRSKESQAEAQAAWKNLLHAWNIHGSPMSLQDLRERILIEGGSNPENNEVSTELIARRQEQL
jgi:hypothetical protein